MAFKPIVIDQGQLKQLPTGHAIDCGGWTLPSPTADNQLLVSTGSTTVGWKNAADMTDWLKVLAADTTVYVRVTGNDSTGDGSSDSPYKTLTRAFQHVASLWPGDHLITVDIGQGIYLARRSRNQKKKVSSRFGRMGRASQIILLSPPKRGYHGSLYTKIRRPCHRPAQWMGSTRLSRLLADALLRRWHDGISLQRRCLVETFRRACSAEDTTVDRFLDRSG